MGGACGGVFAGLPRFGLFPTFNLVGLKPSNEGEFSRYCVWVMNTSRL